MSRAQLRDLEMAKGIAVTLGLNSNGSKIFPSASLLVLLPFSIAKAKLLAVVVDSEARRRPYEKAARHRRVVEHSNGAAETYQVSTPIPRIRTLTHEPVIHSNFDSRRP